MFSAILDLFFPHLCFACQERPPMQGSSICVHCDYGMPPTDYHTMQENPVFQKFFGRLPLQHATAFFNFNKATALRSLIHQLKYRHRPEIGLELGRLYGYRLAEQAAYRNIDAIVPVPLHPKKEHKRGYNQAAMFAQGLSETLCRPHHSDFLRRNTFTETQTKKSRIERFGNVSSVFFVPNPAAIAHKHLLLVDDVITTGATLEACALQLLACTGVRVSIAAIASAEG